MLDIGGWEFLLIVVLGIIIIGPKELPGAIRTVSMFVRRARELARDFQSGLEEVAREAELDKMKDEIKDAIDPHAMAESVRDDFENTIDPKREIRDAVDYSGNWVDDDLVDFSDTGQEPEKTIAPPRPAQKAADPADPDAQPDAATPRPGESADPPPDPPAADEPADSPVGDAKRSGT